MSAKAGKRPMRALTAHEKLEAIRRVTDGESKAAVARDIGVPESTLRGWCKNKEKISNLSRQSSSPDTDGSGEPKTKRPKVSESSPTTVQQPFNLTVKPRNVANYSPTCDSRYAAFDYQAGMSNLVAECAKFRSLPDNEKVASMVKNFGVADAYSKEMETFAKLALLICQRNPTNPTPKSDEMPANSPVSHPMPKATIHPQIKPGKSSPTNLPISSSVAEKPQVRSKSPKEKQSSEDATSQWVKAHSLLPFSGMNLTQFSNGISNSCGSMSSPSSNGIMTNNGGRLDPYTKLTQEALMSWYKLAPLTSLQQSFPHLQPPQTSETNLTTNAEKPILYQQLTKEKDQVYAEDLSLSHTKAEKHFGHSDGSRSGNSSVYEDYTSGMSTPSPTSSLVANGCSNYAAEEYDVPVIQNRVPSILNERNTLNKKEVCNKVSNINKNKIRKQKNGIDTIVSANILADLDNNNDFNKEEIKGDPHNNESAMIDWKTAVQCGEYFLKFVEGYHKNHSAVDGPTHFEVGCIRKVVSKIKANGEAKENH